MEQDLSEQIIASSFDTDIIISDSIMNDNPENAYENENSTNHFLNDSTETIDEQHQIKRTTAAKRKDILSYFIKQTDGSFKCT